ncbi:BRO family protein [Bifidobacterium pseudolongum]|jgi:anti-repressor protein|uniref:BRO family protein n=1 Tax=Bifidobacterium pseudolongum TaxID=1694 RepID=UPI001F0DFFE6|nr:BRO family protein [Bifidobacterium pseudolongum]MCH4856695.1 phage antirepressor KilAC domain-containing protein [Bifidobacterium pseudolongum]
MNELVNLDFEGTQIRVITADDGTPRWALADVCAACGIANPYNVAARLDDTQKGLHTMETLGGPQQITVVNEDGLYDVILDSRKPEARRFRKWVTSEVLPSIRKHGGYIPIQEHDDEKSILARAVLIAQSALADKDRIIDEQRIRIAQAEPLALTAQALCDTAGSMTFTDAARHFMQLDPHMNRTHVIATLRTHGYLERNSLAPTRKATDPGYLKPIIGTRRDGRLGRQYSHFTTKGMGWFINRFIYGNAQGTLTGTTEA